MNISDRMRLVLDQEKLSLREASEKSEIPYTSLQKYVSGGQSPGSEALVKFGSTFNVNLHWLLTGEGNDSVASPGSLTSEINTSLSNQIIKLMKKSLPQYFKHIETSVAFQVFPSIYNQVNHLTDSSERLISIEKAIGQYLLRLNDDIVRNAKDALKSPDLDADERRGHEFWLESGLKGKAKVIAKYNLASLTSESISTDKEFMENLLKEDVNNESSEDGS